MQKEFLISQTYSVTLSFQLAFATLFIPSFRAFLLQPHRNHYVSLIIFTAMARPSKSTTFLYMVPGHQEPAPQPSAA